MAKKTMNTIGKYGALGKYVLVGQTPVPCEDVMEWARWYETADRTVKAESVAGIHISTVFLGVDHNFFGGKPLLFETMTFSEDPDYEQEQERCSTWLEAERQHERVVAKVRADAMQHRAER